MEVNKMKIYAKQVPPEYQESPLFMEDWPENVFVFGNKWLTDRAGRLEDIKQALDDICDVCNGWSHYSKLADVIPARDDGREYTRDERLTLARLAQNYAEYSYNSDDENAILCDVLELITGHKYETTTIRGCCQGDWQEIIYPAEYGREWLRDFETEYFNTGAEWRISENNPESDDNYYFYSHSWSDDGIRAEIAAAAAVDPGDVILYQFTGWSRSPEYVEVS
jgi:hypothetical protein